jgi:hypothetical protein
LIAPVFSELYTVLQSNENARVGATILCTVMRIVLGAFPAFLPGETSRPTAREDRVQPETSSAPINGKFIPRVSGRAGHGVRIKLMPELSTDDYPTSIGICGLVFEY